MKRFRVVAGMLCAVVVGVLSLPAYATDQQRALPLESIWTDESCDAASSTVDPDSCRVAGRASASSGAVSAEASLVSPAGGTVLWTADSTSTGYVAATYRLTQPVRRLDFVVTVRVARARVALAPSAAGSRVGWYLDPTLARHAHVGVGAYTVHSACSTCGYGEGASLLSTWTPGTTSSLAGKDVVLRVHVSRDDGQDVPPGVVTVRAGANAGVSHMRSWGDDAAAVEAIVTRIALS